MSTRADVLKSRDAMEYFTFVGTPHAWRVYRGLGSGGSPLVERLQPTWLVDFDAACVPVVWVAGHVGVPDRASVWRVGLFDLQLETVPWERGRLGALACSPDARRAIVLRLPGSPSERPELWCWSGGLWDQIGTDVVPDVSSKLAWLGAEQIAYESDGRRLVVFDLGNGSAEVGPSGFLPARASETGDWVAFSGGGLTRFSFEHPFSHPERVTGFDVQDISTVKLTCDGQVCTWSEPAVVPKRSRGYLQIRGRRRRRFPAIDDGQALGAAVGPYPWQ